MITAIASAAPVISIAEMPPYYGWASARFVPLGDVQAAVAAHERFVQMEVLNARGWTCQRPS